MVDPKDRPRNHPERVREALGLTRSESHIAVLLAQGKTRDDVVSETARSRTTVKWHIQQTYAKRELSRQIELAQLVASLVEVPGLRG